MSLRSSLGGSCTLVSKKDLVFRAHFKIYDHKVLYKKRKEKQSQRITTGKQDALHSKIKQFKKDRSLAGLYERPGERY